MITYKKCSVTFRQNSPDKSVDDTGQSAGDRFPKWRSIVPKTDDLTLVEIDCGALFEAVNSVKSGITDLFCGIFLMFESETLTIRNALLE